MGFTIDIPDDFDEDLSFIKWQGYLELTGAADGKPGKRDLPLITKRSEDIKPSSGRNYVKVMFTVNYRLVTTKQMFPGPKFGSGRMSHLEDEGMFSFGCQWDYSFAQGNLGFGPPVPFMNPPPGSSQLLLGRCEYLDKHDQTGSGPLPYVYALPELYLKSIPGRPPSNWSLDLAIDSFAKDFGISIFDAGGSPTAEGNWGLGMLDIEFNVLPIPTPDPKIDPIPLGIVLFMEKESQPDISNAKFLEFQAWMKTVRESNLYPVLANGTLPFHMRGHASATGNEKDDMDLSITRRQNVERRLRAMLNGNPVVIPFDRGKADANPADPRSKFDKNVAIYIEETEAKAALIRYNATKP
jgi:hypothetical protein